MSNQMLEEVRSRARMMLKALKGDEGKDEKQPAPVPEVPEDADRLDPRVGDASPTDADLEEAKNPEEGEGEDGGGDPKPGEGTGEEDEEGFDEFGHKDMDPREIKKAFPNIGHLFMEEALDELEENETKPGQTPLLAELLAAMKGITDAVAQINAEMTRLRKGSEAQGRELKKALESGAVLEDRLNKIHETAPAAAPRAIAKAMVPQAETPGFSTHELNQLAMGRKASSSEIALLCLTSQRN